MERVTRDFRTRVSKGVGGEIHPRRSTLAKTVPLPNVRDEPQTEVYDSIVQLAPMGSIRQLSKPTSEILLLHWVDLFFTIEG